MSERAEAESRARVWSRDDQPRSWGGLWGKLAVVALIPLVLYSLSVVADKSLQTYRLRHDAAVLRAEIEAERQENLRLQQELVASRSDQQIEDAARRSLNLARPGDHPVVLTGAAPPPTPSPAAVASAPPMEELPEWVTWLIDRLGW